MTLLTVCVIVSGIVGSFCYDNATPVGDCVPAAVANVVNCIARPQDFKILPSAYDPAFCLPEIVGDEHEPINCQGDPMYTGAGAYVPDWYSNKPCLPGGMCGAACPAGWNWRQVTIDNVGTFRCIDSGGGIKPGYKLVTQVVYDPVLLVYRAFMSYQWVITVDVLYPVYTLGWPGYSLQTYDNWSVK